MAGHRNLSLERRVMDILNRGKDWQDASDRAVATEAGCSRHVVTVVRAFMVAKGMIPAQRSVPHTRDGDYTGPVQVRGGYILDRRTGKVVRDTVYAKRQAGRATSKKK